MALLSMPFCVPVAVNEAHAKEFGGADLLKDSPDGVRAAFNLAEGQEAGFQNGHCYCEEINAILALTKDECALESVYHVLRAASGPVGGLEFIKGSENGVRRYGVVTVNARRVDPALDHLVEVKVRRLPQLELQVAGDTPLGARPSTLKVDVVRDGQKLLGGYRYQVSSQDAPLHGSVDEPLLEASNQCIAGALPGTVRSRLVRAAEAGDVEIYPQFETLVNSLFAETPDQRELVLRIEGLRARLWDASAIESGVRQSLEEKLFTAVEPSRDQSVLDLLLTSYDGRLRVLPGQQQGSFHLRVSDDPAGEMVLAFPYVIEKSGFGFLAHEIEEFEALINSVDTTERQIQKFLEAHPRFLLGQEHERLYPQVVLERQGQGNLIPDFLLQPFDRSFCNIVDLKLPQAPVIAWRQNREGFSRAIHDAVNQLHRYRDYFEDPWRREIVRQRYGITAYRPRLAVIVGRRPHCDPVLYRQIEDTTPTVQVVTYDDLLDRARHHEFSI